MTFESRIENEAATQMQKGTELAGASPQQTRSHFLAALALGPPSQAAFDAAREATAALEARQNAPPRVKSLSHTVRPNETASSLVDLYYGDRSLGDVIEKANRLKPGAPLSVGHRQKVPEVTGIPFLRPD